MHFGAIANSARRPPPVEDRINIKNVYYFAYIYVRILCLFVIPFSICCIVL